MRSPEPDGLVCSSGTTTQMVQMSIFSMVDRLEPDRALRLRTWNAQTLLEIADCEYGVVPTQWQLESVPTALALSACK